MHDDSGPIGIPGRGEIRLVKAFLSARSSTCRYLAIGPTLGGGSSMVTGSSASPKFVTSFG